MLAHQIWSCHMAQDANFENSLLCSNFVFNIRKSHKFLVEKLTTSEVISRKPHRGRKTPHHTWDVQYLPTSDGIAIGLGSSVQWDHAM